MEVYKYQIRPVDWFGWKMISISYDQFEVKILWRKLIKEPKNITAIKIQCQSCYYEQIKIVQKIWELM